MFFFCSKSTKYLFFKLNKFKIFSLLCIFLFIGANSYSGQLDLKISPGWIKGSAESVPLGQILSQFAHETGCSVYLDETLNDSPVTFLINQKLSHEKGIQKIVRPHSYALVFSGKPNENTSNIIEIYVFKKGQRNNAKFLAIHNTGYSSNFSHNSDTVFKEFGNSPYSSSAASDVGRSINYKKKFRQNYIVEKSAYGSPVIKKPSGAKGPDYRMSAMEMKKAREDYSQAKYETDLRNAESTGRQGKKAFERDKRQYQEQRNQMLKKYIMQQSNDSSDS